MNSYVESGYEHTSIEHSFGNSYSGAISAFVNGNDTVGGLHVATASNTNSKNFYSVIGIRRNDGYWDSSSTPLAAGDYIPGIGFAGVTDIALATLMGASILGVVDGAVAAGTLPTGIVFNTSTTGNAGLTERFRVGSGGNIGIGDF